jgi:GR25 family glycosyltransferase involved in LPS biosynthesis
MYEGFYINLERDVPRKNLLEQQLADAGLASRYTRFAAIDGAKITYGPDAVPGSALLGCTLSHLSVVKSRLHTGRHLHIIEDDAVLHPKIGQVFENFVKHEPKLEWDVLMTDIFLPPDLYLFKYLHRKYQTSAATGSVSFLDIGNLDFAGSTSYFVNKDCKEKFLQLMEYEFSAETPYDLRIRTLAKCKLLKVYACFPFFSTLSSSSNYSTIAGDFEHVLPLSEYRRSFYIDPELEQINNNFSKHLVSAPDIHMQIYMNLVRSLIDPNHTPF